MPAVTQRDPIKTARGPDRAEFENRSPNSYRHGPRFVQKIRRCSGSRAQVSDHVNGKRGISKAQVKKLAECFGISAELYIKSRRADGTSLRSRLASGCGGAGWSKKEPGAF